jgi:hypothetical protein
MAAATAASNNSSNSKKNTERRNRRNYAEDTEAKKISLGFSAISALLL